MIMRPIQTEDREAWEPLWQGYLDFYRTALTPEVTEQTWAALCDPSSTVHGLVAEHDHQLVGLAHVIMHATTWADPAKLLFGRSLRRQAVARPRHRPPPHRGRLRVRRRVRRWQRLLAHPGVQRARTLPVRHARAPRLFRRVSALTQCDLTPSRSRTRRITLSMRPV